MSRVKVVLTHKDARVPKYAKPGDAGCDVRAVPNDSDNSTYLKVADKIAFYSEKGACVLPKPGDYVIPPGKTVMIDLGLRIQLEPGWEMQVRSRSGMAKRGMVVVNSPGTIDSGYRGPCMVLMHNLDSVHRVITPGTRVAQFVLKRAPQAEFVQVDELDDSERGEGGFGSTGTK